MHACGFQGYQSQLDDILSRFETLTKVSPVAALAYFLDNMFFVFPQLEAGLSHSSLDTE